MEQPPPNQPTVLFEDESVLVVDKPAGMVVHDGPHSLASWLAAYRPTVPAYDWPDPGRAGIVHRLDRGTSGAMVVAKHPTALHRLQDAFRSRRVTKVYWAIVWGQPQPEEGSVTVPVGRHPGRKTPMTVVPIKEVARGPVREAATDYRVLERLPEASLVEATIRTGRTHQIRVHLKYIGHPIVGDPLYNTKPSRTLAKSLGVTRPLLHATRLGFPHPATGEWVALEAPPPADFREALAALRARQGEDQTGRPP